MPQPSKGDVHVNVPLTQFSVAYIQNESRFIADQVFPNIPSDKQSNRYFTYDKEYWFRSEVRERAPGTESAGSGFEVDNTPTYYCKVYAVHKDVDDQTRANVDSPLALDRDATMFCTQQMLLKKDLLWASTYFKTGVWATDRAGVASGVNGTEFLQWDVAGSDPIDDITAQAVAIDEDTGFLPNTLVIDPYTEQVLLNHPAILDRIKYTQGPAIPTRALLAQLFGVDRVLVARATRNSAAEHATESMSYVFGKGALLMYVNPNPSILMPSAGYTFSWSGLYGAGALGTRTKRFRIEAIESDRIEMEMAFDMKVIATDVAAYFADTVS